MKRLVSSLAGLLLVVSAHAAIEIGYSIDGGATTLCTDAISTGPVTCSDASGTFTIHGLSAGSNSPGTAPLSFEVSSALQITNTTGATHTIDISVVAQDFSLPVAPPDILVNSHIGGTVVVGRAANALTFKSCLDTGNTLTACPGGSLASPTGSPAITSALAFSNDQFLTVSSLVAPYAIDELLHLTLGGGGSVNLAASTTLTQTAVPEPASIALLGGALLLVSGIRRKRNQSQKA